MFETAMNVIILALALESVLLVLVLTGWLGTQAQKNLKETEAAEAQRKAWISSDELNKALKVNLDEAKKAHEEGMTALATAVTLSAGFSRPAITH